MSWIWNSWSLLLPLSFYSVESRLIIFPCPGMAAFWEQNRSQWQRQSVILESKSWARVPLLLSAFPNTRTKLGCLGSSSGKGHTTVKSAMAATKSRRADSISSAMSVDWVVLKRRPLGQATFQRFYHSCSIMSSVQLLQVITGADPSNCADPESKRQKIMQWCLPNRSK